MKTSHHVSSYLKVLHEDNHLIAVMKPAGLLTQGDASGAPSLMDATKAWLKEKYAKPGNVFLGLVHRLDKPVAGVVVFAKTSKGASRLSEQFRTRAVKKIYHAIVERTPVPGEATLSHYLGGEGGEGVSVSDRELPGTKPARLRYRVIETWGERALVEITLETGRKHQIRAQLGHIGSPIRGDVKYGASERLPDGAIALVAKRLELRHPVRQDETIGIEVPSDLCPLRSYR